MLRQSLGVALFLVFASIPQLFAGRLPLSFQLAEPTDVPPLVVHDYQIAEGPHLQLKIHIGPAEAQALQKLTANNVGHQLLLKQGERILSAPMIRAAIQTQDFVVSFKSLEDLQNFRNSIR